MPTFWPYIPAQVREVLEFATDIRRARDGEFRDSLKDATERLGLRFVMQPAERTRAELLFRSQPRGEWYVPLWGQATFATSGVSASAGTLTVDTNADYRAGGRAAIVKSDTEAEIVNVSAVGSGSITIGGAEPVASYAAPFLVAPVGTFIAPEGITRSVEYAREFLEVEFVRIDPVDLGAWSPTVHRTYAVLTDASYVVQALGGGIKQSVETVANGFGVYAIEAVESYERYFATVSFADHGGAARWARRRFLHDVRGRDKPFWLPSWKNDLPLNGSVASGATTISVQDLPVAASEMVGRSIQFNLGGGTLIHREVTAAVDAGSSFTLTIAAPGQTVPADTQVSLMELVRFDTDAFEIEHQFLGDDFLARWAAPVLEVAG